MNEDFNIEQKSEFKKNVFTHFAVILLLVYAMTFLKIARLCLSCGTY